MTNSIINKVFLKRVQDRLSRLVALPSVSSSNDTLDTSNAPVVEQAAEWLERLGLQVEIQEVKTSPRKVNLIARWNPRQEDPASGLVLSGHIDTVPAEEKAWTGDPWKLREVEEQWLGLGVSDMKGFSATVITLMEALHQDNRLHNICRPLAIVLTADEESTMAGARSLMALKEPLGKDCWIGEPTGMCPIVLHKGMMSDEIVIYGKAAHASRPDLGHSAIEAMRRVMDRLDRWRGELALKYRQEDFALPHPTLNFGHLEGGDAPNRVADMCRLKLDLRLAGGLHLEEARKTIAAMVEEVLGCTPFTYSYLPLFEGVEVFETPKEAFLAKALPKLSGAGLSAIDFATEGPFFNAMGMQSVIFGPGRVENIHCPDESLNPLELLQTAEVLEQVLFWKDPS